MVLRALINVVRVKLATIKREFVDQYEGDFTYVVVDEGDNQVLLRLLNFPDRQPIKVPALHVNVFDEV